MIATAAKPKARYGYRLCRKPARITMLSRHVVSVVDGGAAVYESITAMTRSGLRLYRCTRKGRRETWFVYSRFDAKGIADVADV